MQTTTKRGHAAARQAQRRKPVVKAAPRTIQAEVTLSRHTPPEDPTGVRKLYAFGLRELSLLFGITEGAVRTAIFEKRVDPTDMESVCMFWRSRADRRAARTAA